MARNLLTVDLPLTGGGEQSAASPGEFAAGEAWRLENGWIVGRGIVAQVPDWRLAATMKNATGTPPTGGTESHAVVGIFPFAQIGNIANDTSGGIIFSFNTTDNKIYLHHLDEDGNLLRTVDTQSVLGSWTLSTPPQITGFEMKGRLYFCLDGREAAASRTGLCYYDPSTGTITKPSVNLETAGAGALLFKGISLHQGGTILGWGYNKVGDIDAPHLMRYNKYTDPDTWIAAATDGDITAGKFPVGTVSVPIIGCAQSGQYTIIGKEREVFALDGNFSSQFNIRPIGNAHGPISSCGIVSIGPSAVWMSEDGPALSMNGGNVEQLGIDKILRRFLTYFDLTYAAGVHDSIRNRVGWLLKRQYTLDGDTISKNWSDEILWWDYQRDLFYVERTPETCFSIGILKGTGQTAVGPSAPPSSAVAASVTANSAQISWTNGDTASGVTTTLEYRVNGTTTYTIASASIGAGVPSFNLTGLLGGSAYDVRLTHYRNGIASAQYSAASLFTTGVGAPTGLGSSTVQTTSAVITWGNGETGSYTTTLEYKQSTDATWTVASSAIAADVTSYALTGLVQGVTYDARLRHIKASFTGSYATSLSLFTTSGSSIAVPTLTAVSGTTGSAFQVNWTNGNAAFTTRVEYKKTSDSAWTLWATAAAAATSSQITGRVASTAYDVRVAHTDSGTGNLGSYATSSPYVTTSGAVPTAPTLTAASGVGQTGLTVNWTNGTTGVGVTTTVEYRVQGAGSYTVISGIASGTATQALTGLTAGTIYDVRVKHVSSGVDSAYATNTAYETTVSPPPSVGTPTSFTTSSGGTEVISGKTFVIAVFNWTRGEFSAGSKTEIWEAPSAGTYSKMGEVDSSVTSSNTSRVSGSGSFSYKVRHKLSGGQLGDFSNVASFTFSGGA